MTEHALDLQPRGVEYGIMAFSLLYALPGIVVLAAIGANVYWMSLVMKMPDLLGRSEAVAAA